MGWKEHFRVNMKTKVVLAIAAAVAFGVAGYVVHKNCARDDKARAVQTSAQTINLEGEKIAVLDTNVLDGIHKLDSIIAQKNLAIHKKVLEHILYFAHHDSVRNKAMGFYCEAQNAYEEACKQPSDNYKISIELIRQGNTALANLDEYNREFHTQYYSVVIGHTKSKVITTNRFPSPRGFEVLRSTGYRPFYIKETTTSSGSRTEEIPINIVFNSPGQEYPFPLSQQLGFCEWKQPHRDNSMKETGFFDKLNPKIEEVPEECKEVLRYQSKPDDPRPAIVVQH